MNRLMCANMSRLLRDRFFWICLAFMGLIVPLCNGIFGNFFYALSATAIPAAFCPLFLGAEYSDGTMRNKIAMGFSRFSVYLSDFTVCAVAGVLFNSAWLAGTLLLHRDGGMPIDLSLPFLLCIAGVCLAWTALFALLSLLIQSKAHAAVACLLTAVVTFLLGIQLTILINAAADKVAPGTQYPLELLRDLLPGGQAYVIAIGDFVTEGQLVRFPLYSLGLTGIVTIVGMAMFCRRDLR